VQVKLDRLSFLRFLLILAKELILVEKNLLAALGNYEPIALAPAKPLHLALSLGQGPGFYKACRALDRYDDATSPSG
jgi:hypothetical protein